MTIDRRTLLTSAAAAAAVAALPSAAPAKASEFAGRVMHIEHDPRGMIDDWMRKQWWHEIDAYLDRRIPNRGMATLVSMINWHLIMGNHTLFDPQYRHNVSLLDRGELMDGVRLSLVMGAGSVDVMLHRETIDPSEWLELTRDGRHEDAAMIPRLIALEVTSGFLDAMEGNLSIGMTPRWMLPLIPCGEDIASGKLTGRFRSWLGWADERPLIG